MNLPTLLKIHSDVAMLIYDRIQASSIANILMCNKQLRSDYIRDRRCILSTINTCECGNGIVYQLCFVPMKADAEVVRYPFVWRVDLSDTTHVDVYQPHMLWWRTLGFLQEHDIASETTQTRCNQHTLWKHITADFHDHFEEGSILHDDTLWNIHDFGYTQDAFQFVTQHILPVANAVNNMARHFQSYKRAHKALRFKRMFSL